MKELFDFNAISQLLHRGDFTMVFDGMCGAAGPYAKVIFERELKSKARLMNCEPKPDFNGGHPDPNL